MKGELKGKQGGLQLRRSGKRHPFALNQSGIGR